MTLSPSRASERRARPSGSYNPAPWLDPRALLVVACAAAIACGPDPDVRHPDWEDHFNRANRATADGQHDQAIAIGKASLKSHPGNADGRVDNANRTAPPANRATGATRGPRSNKRRATIRACWSCPRIRFGVR